MLLLFVSLLCCFTSCDKDQKQDVISDCDIISSENEVIPADVSLSDVNMELGYGITRKLDAVGGEQIQWFTSDGNIASVDGDGNVKGVDLGECVITATNEFGRSAQCHVNVKKTCYLTFDDGPLSSCEYILNALKETDVKATFFLCETINLPVVKRIHDEGHLIGLHTRKNNTRHCYSDMFIYYTDLDILNDRIEEYTGVRANIIRFPGGSSNHSADPLTMRRIINGADDLGYRVFDWTISTGDASIYAGYENSCHAIDRLCIGKQEIILMHDKYFNSRVIRKIVPKLISRGYVFETLDHYPEESFKLKSAYSRNNSDFPSEGVELSDNELEIEKDASYVLAAEMTPKYSTDFIVWQSSDESVVRVDKGGKVKAIGTGEAIVTARTTSGKTAQCTCRVIEKSSESSGS